ncbi:MAG: sensor histidine kinase [Armatimonadota bacterium]
MWLPVVGWVAVAVVATQALLHSAFMDIPMPAYHVASGLIQAILILVPAALYVVWRHAAERERAALAELRESEQLRDELTAMLVHDLKNPVITAAMALDVLLEETEGRECLPPPEREMMVSARRNLRRLEGMIGDVLSINAAQAGRMQLSTEPTDLCHLVSEAVEDSSRRATREGIELSVGDRCKAPSIEIDREHIRRVVENLIANAIDHTSSGGRIEVSVSRGEDGTVVSVTDTGDGIDEELSHELFEAYAHSGPSRRQSRSSVGLGLAYCKLAVEAHGGHIWAENVDHGGSRFSFALPV